MSEQADIILSEANKCVFFCQGTGQWGYPYHVYGAEHMAVVVAGLQVLGDVGKCAQVLRVLGCTRNITDLVLCDDVLHREQRQRKTQWWDYK